MSNKINKTLRRIGVTRDLSSLYYQIKQSIADKKTSLNDSAGLMTEKGSSKLIGLSDSSLTSSQLPPRYLEKFDICNDIIQNLVTKFSILQETEQRRLVPKFDDDENKKLDKQIRSIVIEMTTNLKKCEDNMKELILEKTESPIEEQIKNNMKQNIYTKLSEFTKNFKLNEENYMRKYKEIVGEDYTIMNSEASRDNKSTSKKENFLMTDEKNDILAKRDNELTNLLTNINELAQIFKDLQVLVMEQGTILDRIDYNIETAVVNVNEGHKHLVKANEAIKKNCARNGILVLLTVNFILAILLIFKFIK